MSGNALLRGPAAGLLGAAGAAIVLWFTSATAAPGGFPAPPHGRWTVPSAGRQAAFRAGAGTSAAGSASRAAVRSPAPTMAAGRMVRIPAGSYLPLYTEGGRTDLRVPVAAFEMDVRPVTRAEYATFVASHPEWRRSRVAGAGAGAGYLQDWGGDLDFGSAADALRPVTEVPLAAAQAYCGAAGKRLPTTDEWEYVAAASPQERDASGNAAFMQRLLELYTRPRPARPAPVGSIFRDAFGVWDMHGLVWEWVYEGHEGTERHEGDGRAQGAGAHDMADMPGMAHGGRHHDKAHGSVRHDMGCAGSAAGASDTRSYAAFLRYAFRAGLTPGSTAYSLGFRCAR